MKQSRAYVYVLPCRWEDILKVGFSRDPMDRMQQLHARFFEFFDLDRGLLVETDSVRDARMLEQYLVAALEPHSAPSPLVVPRRAAGHTEWYRGAHAEVSRAVQMLGQTHGYRVHAPLRDWVRDRLVERSDLLYQWSERMLELILAHEPGSAERAALEAILCRALDGYIALDIALDPITPDAVRDWSCARRSA